MVTCERFGKVMTLGTNRKLLLEKLVKLAEDIHTEERRLDEWQKRTHCQGDGFNIVWECRIELLILILNQLSCKELEDLYQSVASPAASMNVNNCVLLHQTEGQRILVNGEKLLTHLFVYKMLLNPECSSKEELTSCAWQKCCASFYIAKDLSSLCINPTHYEKLPQACQTHLAMAIQRTEMQIKDKMRYVRPETAGAIKCEFRIDPATPLMGSSCTLTEAQSSGQPPVFSKIVEYEPVRHWCCVSYYEGEDRLGETYYADEHQFQVDGLTDPSSSQRFCLGIINKNFRDSVTLQVRRAIDQGIKLFWCDKTREMHIECLSRNAVFFQSHSFNMEVGFEPHSVVKVPPASSACVFRLQTFTKAIQYNLQLQNYTYDTIFNMSTMCTVRVSFVKGWGTSYKRTKITQCPCWIDLTLNGPLRMLDKVLRYLHPPLASLSSGSGGKNSPDFITQNEQQPDCSSSLAQGGGGTSSASATSASRGDVTCSSLGSSTSSLVAVLSSSSSDLKNCSSNSSHSTCTQKEMKSNTSSGCLTSVATGGSAASSISRAHQFEKQQATSGDRERESCKESGTYLPTEELLPDKYFKIASVTAANDVTMLRGAECGLIDDDDDDLEIMMMS